MEITAQLDEPIKLAIIPTVVLPLTVIGMILTSLATWVAAFFGVELKADGPKRLFEVLMKPKILLFALLSNAIIYGAVKGGQYVMAGPYPLWWVQIQNAQPKSSSRPYNETKASPNILASAAISSIDVVWKKNLKELIFAYPVIYGTSLFAGTESGCVLEIDLANGEKLRHFEIGKPVMTSPIIWQQRLYAGEGVHDTHHARLYSFDLKEGSFLKAFQTQGHIERAPTLVQVGARSVLLTPSGKDGLNAVDAETMEKIWQAPIGHIDSFPIADSERVYVGTGLEKGFAETGTKVFALEIHSGEVLWEKELPTSSWGIPVLWKNIVCFGAGDVYKNTHYGQLSCYDRVSGTEYFAFNTSGALISQPIIADDHLIVSDIYGKIYQFNLQTKSLEWTLAVPTQGESYSSVVRDSQDRLILPGKEGLYVYSRQDQKLLFIWKPSETWKGSFNNVVIHDDLWILADKAGVLRALKVR